MDTTKIIAIAAPVSITAAEPVEGEEKKGPAKFEATFYTGGAMNIGGYDKPVVVDLAGLSRGNVLVANQYHDSTRPVGNFDLTNDGKSLVAHGTATAATAARDEVVNSAKDGYQWQASLEVIPHEIETLGKGKTAVVNGQQVTGPAYITRKGTLKGFGFVTHGADDNTTVAIAASAASKQEKKKMRAEVKAWVKATFKMDDDTIEAMDAETVLAYENTFDVQAGAKPKEPEKKEVKGAAGSAVEKAMLEAKRCEELEAITASHIDSLPREQKTSECLENIADMKAKAIEEGWSPSKLDMEFLRCSINVPRAPIGNVRSHNKLTDKILSAAICLTSGLKDVDKKFSDEELQKARDRFPQGIGLNELFKIAAEDRGYRDSTYRVNIDMQRAAFGMTPQFASTGFSTLSLPGILSDSAYKFLLEGWGGGEMTWQQVTDITSVRDFKTITQYKLSGSLKYEKVGAGGELKHGTVSEDSYSVKADTYGKMFAITREHIINDDLSALSAIPRELGYGANDAFNDVFWTEFLSGDGGFFANTSSGTITAATVLASLALAEEEFFELTKPNGEPLGVTPNLILAPNAKYRIFLNAMASTMVTGGSTTVPSVNSFAGDYQVVRSAYLSNTNYSGSSSSKWYLMVVRPGFAPIQTAFLNGQQAPMIETASADFNTLGVQMRGVHDFGVKLFEANAVVQGSGA